MWGRTEPTPGTAADAVVRFTGPRRPLIWLLIKNLLLTIVTVGFYRFWAKTRLRRYFWSHTEITGEPLDYIGRGSELLVGFFIVVAVLVPFGLLFNGLEFLLAGSPAWVTILVQVAYYLGILFLIEIAIYRARRYRLSRTVWRGVRGGQVGSSIAYALHSFAHFVLLGLTLGFSLPWRRVALQRRLINATQFGNQPFAFDGRGRDLFVAYAPVPIAMWCVVGLMIGLNHDVRFDSPVMQDPDIPVVLGAFVSKITWWPLLGLLLYWPLFVRYRVKEFVYFTQNTIFGETSFGSSLQTRHVIWAFITYGAIVVGWTAALLILIGTIVITGMFGAFESLPVMLIALLAFFALPILKVAWLYVALLRTVVESLEIRNIGFVETVLRDTAEAPKFGEGLADALDVGGL